MGTLRINGNLPAAMLLPEAQPVIATARRTLVTGGRGFLGHEGRSKMLTISNALGTVATIELDPLVARRIYTSGDVLSEAEIADGMAALRLPGRDPLDDELEAVCTAYADGIAYAEQQFQSIWTSPDPRAALTRAWEMARKVIDLDKRIEFLKRERDQRASAPGVEGQSHPGRSESNTSGRTPAP